jgi:dTDP-3-amino-3,4,6-trideoxy-alpha-D-glucose transaminase
MILLNDFKRQWQETGADVLAAVAAVGASGWYILGSQVSGFETVLAEYWGISQAIGVASGLDAIELSLRALGCGVGDRVLTSPISAFATALAIIKVGARPVFADCDPRGLIDLEACREILDSNPDIRYFVPVHLYGHSLDLHALRELRDRFELLIVEDCAQSIGATWQAAPTGSVGRFAATSFYPTKNLGAMGDGGAVLTHTAEDAAEIRRLRDYGQGAKYRHDVIGYNSRLDELQAAILSKAYLPRLKDWTATRRAIAARYCAEISSPAIALPPRSESSSWHLFPVQLDEKRKLEAMAYFRARGILVGEHYPLAVVEQPALTAISDDYAASCPRSRRFCRREISLPIHPYLTAEETAAVIEACNEWR